MYGKGGFLIIWFIMLYIFSIAISRSKDVPSFGPPIPENARFPKSAEFAQFLLAKGKILQHAERVIILVMLVYSI